MEYGLEGQVGSGFRSWTLREGRHRIGRDPDNEVILSDDRTVSRHHAVIRIEGETVEVEDLESHNGTWIEDRRLTARELVHPPVRIRLGSVDLILRPEGVPAAAPRRHAGDRGAAGVPATAFLTPDRNLASTRVSWEEVQGGTGAGTHLERNLFRIVTDAARLLTLPHPIAEVFDLALTQVERVVPARRILLLLRDAEETAPVVRATRPAGLAANDQIMLSRTLLDAVLTARESVLVTDAQSDPRFRGHESIVLQKVRSAVAAPLFDNERVLGLIYADTDDPLLRYDPDQLRAFTLLANLIAIKITNTRLVDAQREKERLEHEMATAARIQRALLPAALPSLEGYEIAADQIACDHVAGDLYDASPLPDGRCVLVLGDVSGKGLGAALLMSHVMACLRVLYGEGTNLTEMVDRVHRQVLHSSGPTHFVTLFVAACDPGTHRLQYVNAGHNPPFLIDPAGNATTIEATGTPAGLIDGVTFEAGELTIPPEGLLCVYSDGVTEALSDEGEFFGEERLLAGLLARRSLSIQEILDGLKSDLKEFLGPNPPNDDVTLVLLRRKAEER